MQIYSKKIFYIRLTVLALIVVVLAVAASFYQEQKELYTIAKHKYKILAYQIELNKGMTNVSATDATDGSALTVPVLVYHGIVPVADRFSMTLDTFKDHIFSLKRAGYETVTLSDLAEFKAGKKELPAKSIVITFDDGRRDSYLYADPILEATGYKATMFVATAASFVSLGDRKNIDYYIHEREINRMLESGRWEIGSHAVQEDGDGGQIVIDAEGNKGNFLSNKKWLAELSRLETDAEYEERIKHELTDARSEFKMIVNHTPIAFSYPFGDYGQQTLNNPRAEDVISKYVSENYEMAFQQIWPVDNNFDLNYKKSDPYHLRRIESGTSWSGEDLVNILNRGKFKLLPYVDDFSVNSGWKKTWGNIYVASSTLQLSSATSTNGAFTFLDGTYGWENYYFDVNADWRDKDFFSLAARFQDSKNYAACTFGNGFIAITETVEGQTRNLFKVRNNDDVENKTLSISVKNNVVKCFVGPKLVASAYNLNSKLDHGGIGVRIWNDEDKSGLIIRDLKAFAI